MESYRTFAEVYDRLMEDIPYEDWCQYLTGLLKEYGISDGLVLELGCGTGTMTELLAGQGYDMIGVDASQEMLAQAMEKREESGHDILYLQQDMREFELYGTVRAVVSVCDSMNYILEDADLVQVFSLVNNYLDPGGIVLFDLKTEHYYRDLTGDAVYGQNEDDVSMIWENYYYEEDRVNEYHVTIFLREADGRYRKEEETHYQRAYSVEEVRAAMERAGMEFVAAYDAGTKRSATEMSERIYIVGREKGKHAVRK